MTDAADVPQDVTYNGICWKENASRWDYAILTCNRKSLRVQNRRTVKMFLSCASCPGRKDICRKGAACTRVDSRGKQAATVSVEANTVSALLSFWETRGVSPHETRDDLTAPIQQVVNKSKQTRWITCRIPAVISLLSCSIKTRKCSAHRLVLGNGWRQYRSARILNGFRCTWTVDRFDHNSEVLNDIH